MFIVGNELLITLTDGIVIKAIVNDNSKVMEDSIYFDKYTKKSSNWSITYNKGILINTKHMITMEIL